MSKSRFPLMVMILVLLCCLLTASGTAVLWVLPTLTVQPPAVLINMPAHNENVLVGQPVAIQAVARAEQKIKRIELWVDGVLLDAQTSALAEGVSPFPLTTNWQARAAGVHSIVVRAFNQAGKHGQAQVNVNAAAMADRDHDGVLDNDDACPDQPGSELTRGCPDRDNDGIRDTDDACPDQAGLPANRGCPAPSAQDRDGDGVIDSADACPDQPGSPLTGGCPDSDGDGVRDADDQCPREQGLPSNQGCPLPNDRDGDGVADVGDACPDQPGSLGGCPDGDEDGVRDRDDACPDAAGVPGASGCPDRDGDGVRDTFDLCPDTPGPRDNAGCPRTSGDRDGDGVDDDHDLAPGEPGSADGGGAPPPGGGGDTAPTDPLDDFAGAVAPGEHLAGVTFEALEFQVNGDYDEVYCYTSLGGAFSAVERIGPFDALAERHWDIAEYIGGANSRFIALPFGSPLNGSAECHAYTERVIPGEGIEGTYWNLGSVRVTHPSSDWDGHVITKDSTGGASGRTFQIKYRMCAGSCRSSDFPAPILHLYSIGGRHQLVWLWSGNDADIEGFRVYVNGHRAYNLRKTISSHYLSSAWEPACGERRTFQLTAYRGDRESPLSNLTYWSGQPCPRRVRVTFQSFTTSGFGDDELHTHHIVGPIRGELYAEASARQTLSFRGDYCHFWFYRLLPMYTCDGRSLLNNFTYSVAEVFRDLRRMQASCLGNGCPPYSAPDTDAITLDLGANDDLTIGGRVIDVDELTSDETIFRSAFTIRSSNIRTGSHLLRDRKLEFTILVELLTSP